MKSSHKDILALGVLWAALLVGFGVWPTLDIWFSGLFFDAALGYFPGSRSPVLVWINQVVPWLGRLMLVWAGVVLVAKWFVPTRIDRWRMAASLTLSLVLGLGLAVHAGLKENWGRARPDEIQAFNGTSRFTPPMVLSDQCTRNCSFVSGHAATGFAILAVGMLAGQRRRWHWLAAGIAAGLMVGMVRVVVGKHFLSDILFCLAVMWTVSLMYRWVWIRAIGLRRRRRRHRIATLPENKMSHSHEVKP